MRGFVVVVALALCCWPGCARVRADAARADPAGRRSRRPSPPPKPAAPPATAGAAPRPRRPRRPAAVPGGRQDRLRRAAAHRQRVGRRQGGHGTDSGAAAEEGRRAEREEQAAPGHAAEARKGRLGDERDRAGRSAEAGRADPTSRSSASRRTRSRRFRICRTQLQAAVPAAHRADPRGRSARRRACTSSSTVPTRAWSGPTPASTSRPTSSRSWTRAQARRRRRSPPGQVKHSSTVRRRLTPQRPAASA